MAKLPFVCDQCGVTGTVEVPVIIKEINTGIINISDPCPICGAKITVPGGKYRQNDEGMFERIGDYDGPPPNPAVAITGTKH